MEEETGALKRGREQLSENDVAVSDKNNSTAGRLVKKKRGGLLKMAVYSLPVLAVLAAVGIWLALQRRESPVPKSISSSVSFPVFYPDAKLLPEGFTIHPESLSSANNTLVYKVSYGAKKLVITEQPKPSDQEISTFYKRQMPIHTEVLTPVGTATVGALNMQNVVSLPTNDKTWLLITYPDSVTKDQLKQFLKSIRR